jgi:hypothetical protein
MKKRISVVVLFHNWRTLRTMTTAALTSNLDRSMAYQFTDYCLMFTDYCLLMLVKVLNLRDEA